MNILIVDDEVICAEGIKCSLNWTELGICEVYTACSVKQAQAVFKEHEIQILVTDVEMPKENGFDLLKWLKDNGYTPVSIMLTSYATFPYAKSALEYHCLDYILKPATTQALTESIRKAADKVREDAVLKQNLLLAGFWTENEFRRLQLFWRHILTGTAPLSKEQMLQLAESQQVATNPEEIFLPLYFRIFSSDTSLGWTKDNQKLAEFLRQYIYPEWREIAVTFGDDLLFTLSPCPADKAPSDFEKEIRNGAAEYIERCGKELKTKMAVYIGQCADATQMYAQYRHFISMDMNNVSCQSAVFSFSSEKKALVYEKPDLEAWTRAYSENRFDDVIKAEEEYLDRLVSTKNADHEILHRLFHDCMQDFYSVIGERGIRATLLFGDDKSEEIFKDAVSSVMGFKIWFKYMIRKSSEYIAMLSNTESVVQKVKKYIQEHLSEELSRTQIVSEIYLSPDYLSHIFKQETGKQLQEYITEVRLTKARQLLTETDTSISEVAYQTGYYNLPYFSRVFRSKCKMTPAQYRKMNRGK